MTDIRACTTLSRLHQERTEGVQPTANPQHFGREDDAVAHLVQAAALAAAPHIEPDLRRPSPSQQMQNLEELPRQLEGTQRFMQYYVTSAPHARSSAPMLPATNWKATDLASYTGMEWDSVLARSNGTDSVMLVNMVMDGFVGFCADINHRLDNGECFFGPYGAFWSSLLVMGMESGYNDAGSRIGGRFNGNINLSASDHAFLGSRLIGGDPHTEDGFEAARIRSHLSLAPNAPAFRAEVSSTNAWGVCGAWGLSAWTWIRALCRIDYTSSQDISYSTWTSGIAGRVLSMDGMNVFNQWLHNMYQTVRRRPNLVIPKVEEPECMQPGATLRQTFNHRYGKLFTAGMRWAYAGHHLADVDQTKILLTREVGAKPPGDSSPLLRAESKHDGPAVLAIKVSAQQVASRRWFAVISGGAGADTGVHRPNETTFSLKVALTPENLAAYKVFVEAIRKAQTIDAHRAAVKAFVEATQTSYREESVTGHITSSELGVRVGLFPMNLWGDWVPRGFAWGLGRHNQTSHMTQTSPGEDSHDFFLNQAQDLRGPDGERTTDAVAVVKRAPPGEKECHGGVILSTRIRLSRADGEETTRLLVDPLNTMYGAGLAPLLGAGWRVSREVGLEQCLTPAQLLTLATRSDAELVQAAHLAQCPIDALRAFVAALRDDERQPAEDMSAAILDRSVGALGPYLSAAGASGVAAVYRALAGAQTFDEKEKGDAEASRRAPKLVVRSHSDAYERPRAILDTLYLRYHDANESQRKAMQKAVVEAQDEILQIAQLVREDSFTDVGQKDALLAECSECSKQLTRLYFQPAHKPTSKALSQFALDLQNFSARHNVAAGMQTFTRGDATHKEIQALRGKLGALLQDMDALSQDNQTMLVEAEDKLQTWEALAQ